MSVFYVVLGGAMGALFRYISMGIFPVWGVWNLLLVNGVGSFLLGCLYGVKSQSIWLFLGIGFCGAFTTFSTFSLYVVQFIQLSQPLNAMLYIVLSNGVCLFGCAMGMYIRQLIS